MKKVLTVIAGVILIINLIVIMLVAFIESKSVDILMYICIGIDLVITLVYNAIEMGE